MKSKLGMSKKGAAWTGAIGTSNAICFIGIVSSHIKKKRKIQKKNFLKIPLFCQKQIIVWKVAEKCPSFFICLQVLSAQAKEVRLGSVKGGGE